MIELVFMNCKGGGMYENIGQCLFAGHLLPL